MDLHLDVDGTPGRTLRARTEHALREAVRGGGPRPGTRLPATRALATQLGVSRGVVVEAYAQLAAEGYLDTRRGGGTRVAQHPGAPPPLDIHGPAALLGVEGRLRGNSHPSVAPRRAVAGQRRPEYDLRPSLPAVDGFPRQAWL